MSTKITVCIPTYNRSEVLRDAIESVLSQTLDDFALLISDNASDDDTRDVVAAYGDSRICFSQCASNIGQNANFNRLIELTTTEYLLLLPDDDSLAPTHLASTLEVLERYAKVGAVHTGFDVIDAEGEVVERCVNLVEPDPTGLTIESGGEFLRRAMRQNWLTCLGSTLFRTEAITGAGGLRAEDYPVDDFSLMLRVACDWNLAHLARPLARFRVHASATSLELGTFVEGGYMAGDEHAPMMLDRRTRFLAQTDLAHEEAQLFEAIARSTFRRDRLRRLRNRAGADGNWWETNSSLARFVLTDPQIVVLPDTWLLFAAQLGGRHAKRLITRRRKRPVDGHSTADDRPRSRRSSLSA